MKESKLVKINKEKKWKIKKILNKNIIQECVKYLVRWKMLEL